VLLYSEYMYIFCVEPFVFDLPILQEANKDHWTINNVDAAFLNSDTIIQQSFW